MHLTADELWIASLQSLFGSKWVLEYWRTDISGRFFRTPEEWKRYLADENTKKWKKERIHMRIEQVRSDARSKVRF